MSTPRDSLNASAHGEANSGALEKKSAVTAGAPSLDGHVLAERYEALREEAVGSGMRCDGVCGLALLMRNGMAAWMRSVGEERVRDDVRCYEPGTCTRAPSVHRAGDNAQS